MIWDEETAEPTASIVTIEPSLSRRHPVPQNPAAES
jgi:hypothetical protein